MGRAYEVRKASIQKNGAQKAKLFSNMSKEIYQIAKNGDPDPNLNINLKRIVEKAKKLQVPGDIIDRAIEKAKGNNNDDYKEVIYEGFGPGNSTFMVKCLTDNLNRTVALVREAFTKTKNKLGVSNSVSYNYDYLGLIGIKNVTEEEVFECLLNNGIEVIDIEKDDDIILITCKPGMMSTIKDELEKSLNIKDYEIDEVGYYAKEEINLENQEEIENFELLNNLLNNIEDVSEIYTNVKR